MLKKFSVIAAAAVATVAVAACGAALSTEAQTQAIASGMTDAFKSASITNGLTEAQVADAGFDLTCPSDVKADQDVNCTLKGKLSGESAEAAMKTDSDGVLAIADDAALGDSLVVIEEAELAAIEAGTN